MMAQGGEQLGPDADSQMGIQLGFTEWPSLVGAPNKTLAPQVQNRLFVTPSVQIVDTK